jgi:hypothetical protein
VDFVVLSKPPLERWGFMFADGVHNARAALDNAVVAIARAAGVVDEKALRTVKFLRCY